MADERSDKITIRGAGLHYAFSPGGGGAPVLMLHGTGSSWNAWALNMHHLGAGRAAVVPDLPGFGESDPPARFFSIGDFADFLLEAMAVLGHQRLVAVGNSLGALISLAMAARAPERVAGLVMVSAPAPLEGVPDPALCRLLSWVGEDGVPRIPDLEELGRITVRADKTILALANANLERSQGFLASLPAVLKFPWRQDAARVRCPALVVWGEQDGLMGFEHLDRWKEALPGAEVRVVAGAAHGAHFDKPEEFNRALVGFLDGIGWGRPSG